MKLSKLFEGWEELGIEDPGFEDSKEEPAFSLDAAKDLLQSGVSPEFYLIRITPWWWTLLPFEENIQDYLDDEDYLADEALNLTAEQMVKEVRRMDVSLVMDPDPHVWDVQWIHGWKVTTELLERMKSYF